jgi:subfamily B ATP-binding cassette protein MsbA
MEELPGESFADLMRQQQTAATRSDSAAAAYSPCLWLIVLWGIAFLVLVFGLSPTASVAGATALITALSSAYFPIRRLLRLQAALPGWSRAARDIFAYLDRTPAVIALKEAKPLPPLRHELRVDSVTLLDRHGQRLFDEISFTVPAGGRLAVLASDNQTPRALVGLLARFYDPLAGRILFDDVDIRWATLDSLRRQTGLLLHDALLFSGTVRENIGCGQAEFDIDVIHDAAKNCRAMDMILGLPDGFETIVGESGLKLELWPAYQIALVRALMRNPSLLVIEEPRTALPEREQAAFEEALQLAATGRTLVVLPTRLASLRAATTILLFHQGRLAGQGTHAELLQSSELYRHLNYIRFHPFPHVR